MNDQQKKTILLANLGVALADLVDKKKISEARANMIIQMITDQITDLDFADQVMKKMNDALHKEKLYTEIDYQSVIEI